MATQTDELALFKYNTATDGENVFSIAQALNENWDKIDTFATAIKSLSNLDAEGEKRFEDIWTELDKKLTAEVSLSENGYIKFNNGLIFQYGWRNTDNDGAARITTPISFSNTNWVCVALHTGKEAGVCYEDNGFRNINWIPIRIANRGSGQQGGGWVLQWIAIGY